MIALRVDRLVTKDMFLRQVAELCGNLESCPPAAGFDRVRLPHQLELETKARRSQEGIALPVSLGEELRQLAVSMGIQPLRSAKIS